MVIRNTNPKEKQQMQSTDSTASRFFQETSLTPDDLNCYAGPLAAVVNAVHNASLGFITEDQACDVMRKGISEFKAVDAALDAEMAIN
jgi:hypothetical protein